MGSLENELIRKDIEDLVALKQIELINFIFQKEQEINELGAEERKISCRKKYLESQLEDFKKDVKEILLEKGIEKIETEAGNISVRQNPISVELINIDLIPDEYKIIKTSVSIDKKKIAENFKLTGEIIDGVKINTQNTSLQVK